MVSECALGKGQDAWENVALCLVLRDMGNQVVRIEASSLVPLEAALADAELPGRRPMLFPAPSAVWDAIDVASSALGLSVDLGWAWAGSLRYVADSLAELAIWMM